MIADYRQVADYGYAGEFQIELAPTLSGGQLGILGESEPDSLDWIYYPANGKTVNIVWPKGKVFKFLVYVDDGQTINTFDPSCSYAYWYWLYAPGDHYLSLELGYKDYCYPSFGDSVVSDITNMGGGYYQLGLDFASLPIFNYLELFVLGQSSPDPNTGWIKYQVVDSHPCYKVNIYWPYVEPFHFSGGVVKPDGTIVWFDSSQSIFHCTDHLCLNFSNF
jgi:hypothetical protein